LLWQGSTEGLTVGVVANKRLAAQRRKFSRHIERSIREAERRSPQVAEMRARIRRTVRVGRAAVQSREQAQSRLADALRRFIGEGLSIREAAERVGVTFYDARRLVSGYDASDVLDAEWIAGIVCRPVRSQTWRHD
jgi:translation initiation factor 2B subunit (eIF-2B alpha/beta/delta family)